MRDPVRSSKYILVAEDNPGDLRLVREGLNDRAIAYELHIVTDGDQAFRFIQRIDRDPILHLPKRDANEMLEFLRASERCGQTPVVIITTSDSPRDMAHAARQAAFHYCRKAANLDQYLKLGDIVRDAIGPGFGASAIPTT